MCCNSMAGVRVLECSHFVAGPRTGQILADHGADVIKLEPPGGEATRFAPPSDGGVSIYFSAHNRGKRSLVVDLKLPAGQELLKHLIRWVDVIVTNYTPKTAENLGLDFASASAINDRIVVLQISAFGAHGRARDLTGVDGTIQARTGIAELTGQQDGPPTVGQVQIIDHLVSVEGVVGVLMALRLRDATGKGSPIDLAMMDVGMSMLAHQLGDVALRGAPARRSGSAPPYALANTYETSDGYVYIASSTFNLWMALCNLIGRPDLASPESPYHDGAVRLRDRAYLEGVVGEWTRLRSRAEVIDALEMAGVPCAPINSVADAMADPGVLERGMVLWVEAGQSGRTVPSPGVELKVGEHSEATRPRPRVPDLGADSAAVLAEAGIAPNEVARLFETKVVYGA
jgi:CoA:oxalate CoA-transferase